jgi:hypothetical protein
MFQRRRKSLRILMKKRMKRNLRKRMVKKMGRMRKIKQSQSLQFKLEKNQKLSQNQLRMELRFLKQKRKNEMINCL